MRNSPLWKHFVSTTESADLDDLRRDLILIVSVVVLAFGWLLTLSAISFEGRLEYLPAGFILLGGSVVGLWLRPHNFRAALYSLIVVLLGAIACTKWLLPETPAQYFFPVAIVVSSLMVSSVGVFVVATIASIVCAAMARAHGALWFDPQEIVTPITLIYLTALASWLNARHVNTALDSMESGYIRARELLEQLRDERMKLARTLKSLEDAYVRIEKMNYALIEAHRVAEEARRFKAEFVANVSHELRTPLNLIIGFTEMMTAAPESYGDVPLPTAYRGDMMATYRNARHLRALIDDVLDLSRIEAGSMPLNKESVNLDDVIREAAEMVRGLVEARGLTLELELAAELPNLQIDRTRIRQVLLNLLTNATRFTDAGKIRVSTRLEETEMVMAVEDSGRGIEPARLTQAFEAFSQLENDQARQGSGLGLAVSKQFVELHGGAMRIESQVGHGTTVYFSLPLPGESKYAAPARWALGYAARSDATEPNILILHDDLRVLPLLRRYVPGYQYQLAETVEQARAVIRQALPTAVIMDTTWATRSMENVADLGLPPQVLLIKCPLPSTRRLGALVGAVDYIAKPVSREDLANALARFAKPPETVLVIDDEPDLVRLIERMLKADYPSLRVLEAFGGRQGLAILRAERPDLVLLDLVMPDMDGYAFLEALADDMTTKDTQVVIISATGLGEDDAPLAGDLSVVRQSGFSLTEILRTLQVTLASVTPQTKEASASGAASPKVFPGRPAW